MDYSAIWDSSSTELYSSSITPPGDQEVRLASDNPKKVSGRKKFTETRHPVYRGIRRKNSGRWVCELREPAKQMRIWLGTFPSAEMAARAYDVAAIALRGKSALVNFADSASRMRIPTTTDPKAIQKAAAAGAEVFRSPESDRYVPSIVAHVEPVTERFPVDVEAVVPSVNTYGRDELMPSFGFESENNFYMGEDEELAFGMPGLLEDMAGGMMLPLPDCVVPGGFEVDSDTGLWNY